MAQQLPCKLHCLQRPRDGDGRAQRRFPAHKAGRLQAQGRAPPLFPRPAALGASCREGSQQPPSCARLADSGRSAKGRAVQGKREEGLRAQEAPASAGLERAAEGPLGSLARSFLQG